jgi:hypothetical protein
MYYDFPQVFVGKSAVDQNYCCMVISEGKNGPKYLCTPISNTRSVQLSTGRIDLRRIFETPESVTFFHAYCEPSTEDAINLHLQDINSCPENQLPKPGLIFEDYDEVASKALELNATVSYASLSVPESEMQTRIRSTTLAQFLTHYQNVVKLIAKRTAKELKQQVAKDSSTHSLDVFGFSQGSFTVQLRSSSDGDLFGDNHVLTATFDRLGEFINNIETPEVAIEYLHSIKGHAASSLIRLLEFLDENKCPLKQQWATPRIGESRTSKTTVNGVRNLIEICKQRRDLTEVIVVLVGIVSTASINGNTWKLLNDEDGVQYSGDVGEDSNISMSGIVIQKKRYKFHCVEKIDLNIGTGQEKTQLSVFNIEGADGAPN